MTNEVLQKTLVVASLRDNWKTLACSNQSLIVSLGNDYTIGHFRKLYKALNFPLLLFGNFNLWYTLDFLLLNAFEHTNCRRSSTGSSLLRYLVAIMTAGSWFVDWCLLKREGHIHISHKYESTGQQNCDFVWSSSSRIFLTLPPIL